MLSINLTKQGYRLILIPATGVNWSTIWYTIAMGASGGPAYGGIEHKPDPRSEFDNRQVDGVANQAADNLEAIYGGRISPFHS